MQIFLPNWQHHEQRKITINCILDPLANCRIPHATKGSTLGPPIKYLVQQIHVTNMILSRFEHGDAASFEEVIVSLRHRFGQQNYSEDFHKLLKDPGSLRTWTRRVISRSQFSERVNTISQKVPVKWADIARRKSLLICKTAIELQVDNVFNMDETFILFYPGKDKVLVPKGTKRVGSLVPVENDKKGVTLAVTASLLSSQLLPPFIIDTGSFGADLMTSWSNYTKSTVIFNKSHWMTQYAFIIYLDWLLKMFPCQRSLLIVDRSKTHFGNIITDWLRQIIHHLYQVKSSLFKS